VLKQRWHVCELDLVAHQGDEPVRHGRKPDPLPPRDRFCGRLDVLDGD